MGKINILDSSVFNMLAAGEVVERPASVVKELVENSIDAGATQIDVSIEEGGERLIEVSDNGVGIAREDMRAAFLPHATSKLRTIPDLDSLSTLGFRGEALASIASVSEITAISTQKGEDMGVKLTLSGGRETSFGAASRDEGTAISVANLFFNTPARLKFLKKPSVEQKYVEDVVRRLILANPEISICLYADGQPVLTHAGGSLFDAIVTVYGAKNCDRLLELAPRDGDRIKVRGYVSSPERTRSSRAYECVIVNGRTVEDSTVQTAAEKAFGDLLMKRNFPIFVLDIILPFEDVDVNVHPSKTEVRFADRQAVFGAVYHAVYDAVHGSSALKIDSAYDTIAEEEPQKPSARVIQPHIDTSRYYRSAPASRTLRDSAIGAYSDGFGAPERSDSGEEMYTDSHADGNAPCDYAHGDVYHYIGGESTLASGASQNEEVEVRFDGRIVGQLFSTYLIVERDDEAYIIDQHAAHERVLYDKIADKMRPEFSQPMLVPYRLSLTGEETERLESIIKSLEEMGFEFSFNGSSYSIEAVPEPVSKVNFGKIFAEILSAGESSDAISLASLMRESLCQQACKAAIKGGESLSREQIERVLTTLSDEEGRLPEKCPHGRPAVIAISKTDIEKLFKRIV